MESLNRSYLAFESDGIFYLLPLNEVERIVDRSQETGREFIEFSRLTGGSGGTAGAQSPYGILFHAQSEGTKEAEQPGICVTEIEGILEAEALEEYALEAPVINSRNRYIKAVVRMRYEDQEYEGYLLDVKLVRELLSGCSGTAGTETDCAGEVCTEAAGTKTVCAEVADTKAAEEFGGSEAKGEIGKAGLMTENITDAEGDSMRYITLIRNGQVMYVDKALVTAIVIRPRLLRVPGSGREILGISFYEDGLVVYYDQFELNKGALKPERESEHVCGVIFQTREGNLAGLAGDATGEAAFSAEDVKNMVSLGRGIWVRKSD